LGLVGRLLLWGFAQSGCFRPDLTGQFGGAHCLERSV
jgi:hypothetical protein